jgi:hypothetical protein
MTRDWDWSAGNHLEYKYLPAGSFSGIGAVATMGRRLFVAVVLILACVPFHVFADDSVVLGWNPSTDINVVGYDIYYGGASGVYTNTLVVGNVSSVLVTGLTPGATYYFNATSRNAAGVQSAFSGETSYTAPLPVVLTMNTVSTQGSVTGITITATGTIPSQWMIEASSDLVNWVTVYSGENSSVNVTIPVTAAPAQFFRLVSQ